jgi:hypothetical protein
MKTKIETAEDKIVTKMLQLIHSFFPDEAPVSDYDKGYQQALIDLRKEIKSLY